ncbi:MAG: DUF86 domain-containing protein [Bacteroidetes bacterium]|nr:DUF86 domain-containing protein [Bacteroidota bacterium]
MRIEDIAESIDLIFEYTSDFDFHTWKSDRKTIDAVVRNLEIIGEAASHVPDDIQERFIDIPWNQMKGIRNVLIHEYFGVDTDVLWKTIKEDLPSLREKIEKLL